ncbi:MAG: LmbE family protein, partial [Flavobacteriales bacterium]|nr:LmbE family protein [Flavobacteriales bacterium]
LNYAVPLVYKWKDPVKGELYRPFAILPPVVANFDEETQLFSEQKERTISITVKAMTEGVQTQLNLKSPAGWVLSKPSFELIFTKKGEEQKVKFTLKPTANAELGDLTATLSVLDNHYNQALKTIEYDHIPTQVYLPEAKAQLVYVSLKKKGTRIGYLAGAGDVIPEALTGVGYSVDQLAETDITPENLKQYDAVILGIRAVNVNDRIDFLMPKLLKYCENGGNLLLQYNTAHRLKTENFAPYPLKLSRDRVTEEDAVVTFLKPDHPVLNIPNKLTMNDFDGWVQERGLYFPNEWDSNYEAILSWHDQGEDAKEGSLLVAKYGKGYYVYTGISFFRELPAGVPGAYRLLVNIISLGNE